MAVVLFFRSNRTIITKVCAACFVCIAIWNFAYMFLHRADFPEDYVMFFVNLSFVGFLSLTSFIVWFLLLYTQQKKLLSYKVFYLIMFLIPLLFIITQLTSSSLVNEYAIQSFGWTIIFNNSLALLLLYIYIFPTLVILFIHTVIYSSKLKSIKQRRNYYLTIFLVFFILLICGITDIIIPLSGIYTIPKLSGISFFFMAFSFNFAIRQNEYNKFDLKLIVPDIIESVQDTLIIVDVSGTIKYANPIANDFLCYTTEEIVNQPIDRFFDTGFDFDKMKKKSYLNHDSRICFETNCITKEKKKLPVLLNCRVIRDTKRKTGGFVCLIKDLSVRKKTEAMLKEAEKKFKEADKLKSAFLANMSHEVRTPMNAVIGFTNLLARQNVTEAKKMEYLRYINDGTETLLKLIDDMIEIAKLESGQIIIKEFECNINEIVREVFNYFNEEIETKKLNHIKLKLNIPNRNKELKVITGQFRLQQVLSILIYNSFKFTKKGFVEFGYVIKEKIKGSNSDAHKDTLMFEFYVRDTGIGIKRDQIDVIFDRFTKVETNGEQLYGGAGLGLPIAKKLVKILGGEIWVESIYGKESVFRFTLPFKISEETSMQNINIMTEKNKYNWENKIILVAEDVEINFMFLQESLLDTKAKIIWAKNGIEAIEKAKNNNIDLILMDIKMPDIDGYKASEEIKKFKKHVPIIVQTAYAMPEDKEQFLESKCDDYISKPIKHKSLLDLISKYL